MSRACRSVSSFCTVWGSIRADVPSLRLLTQAGGRLDPDLVRAFAQAGAPHGVEFCVMYGQTEAAPRMSWLPPDMAAAAPEIHRSGNPRRQADRRRPRGAGRHTPRRFRRTGLRGSQRHGGLRRKPRAPGLYRARFRACTPVISPISTPGGLFYIDGRMSRFVKPYGLRVSLDEVEQCAATGLPRRGRHG
jgi:hypothetical protein